MLTIKQLITFGFTSPFPLLNQNQKFISRRRKKKSAELYQVSTTTKKRAFDNIPVSHALEHVLNILLGRISS